MLRRKSDSSSSPSVAYRQPRPGVYTVLLLVALLCLIVGTVFLYLETKDYGPNPLSGLLPQRSGGMATSSPPCEAPVGWHGPVFAAM
jgi:hypothetical protein